MMPFLQHFELSIIMFYVAIPCNVLEALTQPKWKEAIKEEMKALENNGTWDIFDLSRGKEPIECNWVFLVNIDWMGAIER